MIRLNIDKRKDIILSFFDKKNVSLSVSEIEKKIALFSLYKDISTVTLKRDLKFLTDIGYLEREGKGRSIKYKLSFRYGLVREIDTEKYFSVSVDERSGDKFFNFSVFDHLQDIFTPDELQTLKRMNIKYQDNIKKLPEDILEKEMERLVIELSWKSSEIEGNTYSLLETEVLIKEKKEADGHKREEAIMILNHKKAFDYILKNKNKFKKLSISGIEDVHSLLTGELNISKGLRKSPVGITGTFYVPLDNHFQLREVLEKVLHIINKENGVFQKAFLSLLLLSYIQAFNDGNKRTSRLVANAVLLAHDMCPLSYRSVSEVEYKKGLILFYEQNNLSYFKKIFVDQFIFAVLNYFK